MNFRKWDCRKEGSPDLRRYARSEGLYERPRSRISLRSPFVSETEATHCVENKSYTPVPPKDADRDYACR